MKDLAHELKTIILIGGIPVIFFWVSVFLAFIFYPENVEASNNLIVRFVVGGGIIAILLLIFNMRRVFKGVVEK
ncbi:MAG: hypothetical protein Q8P20_09755 [bacterium]|nr:hypothetical protein [bacterium]